MTVNRISPLPVLTTALAGLMLFFSITALSNPQAYADLFGLASPTADGQVWLRSSGARDGVLGLMVLGFAWLASRRSLALLLSVLILQPLSDAAVVMSHSGALRDAAPHLAGAILVAALAAWATRTATHDLARPKPTNSQA